MRALTRGMRNRLLAIAGVVAAVVLAVLVLRGRGETEPKAPSRPTANRPIATTATREVETVRVAVQADDDPAGNLRLEGQVIDQADAPIDGATVVVDSNPPREVKTEADGAFAFDGLTPRTYRLAARAGNASAGPVSIRLAPSTEPVILRVRSAGSIAVHVTDEAGAPIPGALVELRDLVSITSVSDARGIARLEGINGGWHAIKISADGHASAFKEVATMAAGETTVVVTLHRGASVAGTVVDGSGAAIEGARVLPEHLGHVDDLYDVRYDAVLTDAKGRFRLTGLPRETTRIRAHHPSHAPGASSPIVLADGGDRTGVVIVLERGARLRGTVVDLAGAPVPGAEVRVSADTVLDGQVRRVAADASGRFEMSGLPRRPMFVMAASDGATSKTMRVELSAAAADLELRLEQVASIEGVVVTSSGEPVPEARVVAERTNRGNDFEQVELRLRGTESAIAGMDGRFRISPLEPGSYQVRAIRPGSPSDLLGMRLGVPVETGAQARIVVDELSTLTGKVAFEDGKPVTQFSIRLGTAPLRRFSTADGAFVIEDVPAGRQFVEISGPGIVAHPLVDVTIEPTRTTDLGTITVSDGRRITGSVLDRNGRSVAGATIVVAREIRADGTSLVPYPDHRVTQVVTDAGGRFEIRGVSLGAQQIAAEHPTAGRSPMTTIQPGSADLELTLGLLEPGVVQGLVRLDGKPTEALLVLRPDSGADSRITVRTGLDGSYRFDRVAPGRYTHAAIRDGGRRDENSGGKAQRIEVEAGKIREVDVDLSSEGVAVILHIASPNNSVEFAYGVIAEIADPALESNPLPKTISEARGLLGKSTSMSVREGMVVTDRQIRFEKVPAGRYMACAAPLRADPADPSVLAELQRGGADWPLYCNRMTIGPTPDVQHVTVDVLPVPVPAR